MTDKKNNSETPRDLRKKSKRIQESRDALKKKNKEKATNIKKLRGTIDDLKESRNSWKAQYEQVVAKNIKLDTDIKERSNRLKESERKITERDKQLLDLQKKCEELKKR